MLTTTDIHTHVPLEKYIHTHIESNADLTNIVNICVCVYISIKVHVCVYQMLSTFDNI